MRSDAHLPKNYQLVLEVVCAQGAGVHATTSEIFEQTKRRQPTIGYSTVYRALLRLSSLGLVSEVSLPGANSVFYEPAAARHGHFNCRRCGRIEDVVFDVPAGITAELELVRGHTVTDVSLSAQGLCAECRNRVGDAAPS